jgi:MFS family permease
MLDLALFRSAVFSGAVLSASLSYVAQFAVLFLLPFYLRSRGLGPAEAGLVLTAQPLVMMLTVPLAGALSDRVGTRPLVVGGLAVLAAGLLGPATPLAAVVSGMAACGLGFGAFVDPNNSRLLGAAPPQRRGIASGVLAAARNVGMVLGVGLAGAVFTTVLARHGPGAVAEGVSAALRVVAGTTLLAAVTTLLERQPPHGASSAPPSSRIVPP